MIETRKRHIFYGWWIVLASTVICTFGFGIGLYSFGVFFKPMMGEFGWSRALTAAAFSMRRIEGGIVSPIVGWATDKYGPRPVIFTGGVLLGLGFILMYTVNSLILFYLFYGVVISMGMSTCLYLPNMAAISNWFVRKNTRAISLLTVGAGIGGFVFPPLLTLLIDRVGWRWSFVLAGILLWLIIPPLSLVIRRRPEDMGLTADGDPPESDLSDRDLLRLNVSTSTHVLSRDYTLKEALGSRTFWILIVSFFLAGMNHPIMIVHAVAAITDLGISPGSAAYVFGFMVLISIVGRLSFGWLGDFVSKRYLIIITYVLQGAAIYVLMNSSSMSHVYLWAIIYGVGFGGGVPVRPALRAEYFGRSAFAKIGGIMSPIIMIGSFSGPIVAGYVFDQTGSYRIVFQALIVLQILATVVMYFARPANPPEP